VEPQGAERRTAPRVRIELEIDFGSEHNFYSGLTLDISTGGVFVATHRRFNAGERLEFAISLPDRQEAVRGEGIVRWSRAQSELSDAPPGVGLEFVGLSADALEAIEAYVRDNAPLLWET
jgi:uncharacterized protein (TIGR02266 family)